MTADPKQESVERYSVADIQAAAPRFWSNVEKGEDCWRWRGEINVDGYGMMWIGHRPSGRRRRANRISWILANGPIPNGLLVCHKCRNRDCVNPAHLYVGTHSDNQRDRIRDGTWSNPSPFANRTHCTRGHERTPENVMVNRKGKCRVCETARLARRTEARRAARLRAIASEGK